MNCDLFPYFELDRVGIFLKCLGQAHYSCISSYLGKVTFDDHFNVPFNDCNYVPIMGILPRRFLNNFIIKLVTWLDNGGIIRPEYVISAAHFIYKWANINDDLRQTRATIIAALKMTNPPYYSKSAILIRAPFISALSHDDIVRIVKLDDKYMIRWLFTSRLVSSQQLLNIALNKYLGYNSLGEIVYILKERDTDMTSYTYIFDRYVEQEDTVCIEILLMFFIQCTLIADKSGNSKIKLSPEVILFGFYSANYDLFGAVSSHYCITDKQYIDIFKHHCKKNHHYHIAHFFRNNKLPTSVSIDDHLCAEIVDLFVEYVPHLITKEHVKVLKSRNMYKQLQVLNMNKCKKY
jgi:hypothetical protein